MRRQLIVEQSTGVKYYKGRPMRCTGGVHEEVSRLVTERTLASERASVRVLDLAAGAGALTQRILDLGFTDVTAWELDLGQLKNLPEVTIETVDLNKDFAERAVNSEKFGIVLAVEIIEHLENPYHFARQLKQLLAPDGFAIITTPNIESAASRIAFLRTGCPRWFGDYFYEDGGHISPLTYWQLNKVLERAELQIVEKSHNLRDAVIVRDPGSLSTYRAALTAAVFYPLMRGSRDGDIHVLLVQHAKWPARAS
jgi:2-polyprenyl-3-methyl-5-hydroxy-6-metoxy-1,4-benzoquinol methylase